MKTVYTLITICLAMVTYTGQAQDVNITFNVNMANETVDATGVYLAGGGPDCFGVPGDNAMNDDDMDGIWTITVTRPMGFTCPYTFTNGACLDWGCKEMIAGQDCAVGEFNDRLLDPVMSDTVINTCFEACTSDGTCPPPTEPVNITFRVDMNEQTLATDDVVYILGGSINGWCGDCTPMADDDMDGVYEITLEMEQGLQEYKFGINNGDGQETLDPSADADCTLTTGAFTNRVVTVGSEDEVLDINCFEACGACADVVPSYDVTFRVDMSLVSAAFTTPEVNGTFNGWCGSCNALTDEGNGIWSTTISLQEGSYDYKFSADEWTIEEDLSNLPACITEVDGFFNRMIVVDGEDIDLDVVCWSECDACFNSVFEADELAVGVYPNPVQDGTVYFNTNTIQNVEIYNAVGVLIESLELTAGVTGFDVSELAKGAYYLKGSKGEGLGSFIIVD